MIWPSVIANNEQVVSQPDQVVQDFYTWYLSYDGNPLVDHAYRSSNHLSTDMIAFLDEFTQDGMNYDPVLCAQDRPTEINVSPAQVSGRDATVEVTTNFDNHAFSVELNQMENNWLINKVFCKQ